MFKSSQLVRLVAAAAVALSAAIPAHAMTTVFTTSMSGANEFTPNSSLAIGTALVTFDDVANTVAVSESWQNLQGNATVNHIHVASAPGGIGGVVLGFGTFANPSPTTGTYSDTFTLSSSAFASLFNSTTAGLAYVNLHSSVYSGGEIRGFLSPVPEASSFAMMIGGLLAVGALARRRPQAQAERRILRVGQSFVDACPR